MSVIRGTTQAPVITPGPGHTPANTGRTTTMLAPAKLIGTAALAFAIGSIFLLVGPFERTEVTAPAAQGDPVSMEAAWVTGTLLPDQYSNSPFRNNCTQPERTISGDAVYERGYHCATQLWQTDDPRLSGSATLMWNADVHRLGPAVTVTSGDVREVVNDSGRWLCSSAPSVAQGNGIGVPRNPDTLTCVGHGGYGGLMAVLNVDDGDMDSPGWVEGLVFPGTVPPTPEADSR